MRSADRPERIEPRPATDTGSEFCFRLHKAAMGAYITAIWVE